MKRVLTLSICLALSLSFMSGACKSKKSTAPQQPTAGAGLNAAATGPTAIELWNSGQQDQATEKFVSTKVTLNPDSSLLISAEQFKDLSFDEQEKIRNDGMTEVQSLRALVRAVAANGESAIASGNKPEAARHFQAILDFGNYLMSPDTSDMAKVIGRMCVRVGNEGLAKTK